jgi:peptide/nickel transport system permease protein
VVVETVFAWPGLGLTAIQAIERDDLILLQAIVFTVAIMVGLINIVLDIIYKAIDPRLKLTRSWPIPTPIAVHLMRAA